MIQEFTNHPLYSCWPFWALELQPDADTRTIEKAYTKILGLLKLQIPDADKFATPVGPQIRDEFLLRDAKAILLDPEKRALAEFWYVSPGISQPLVPTENPTTSEPIPAPDWKKLLKTI
jgi:hypothetical protein